MTESIPWFLALIVAILIGVDARKHRVSITSQTYSINTGALAWGLTAVMLPFLGWFIACLIGLFPHGYGFGVLQFLMMGAMSAAVAMLYRRKRSLNTETPHVAPTGALMVKLGAAEDGPFQLSELIQKVAAGELTVDHLVRPQSSHEWQSLGDLIDGRGNEIQVVQKNSKAPNRFVEFLQWAIPVGGVCTFMIHSFNRSDSYSPPQNPQPAPVVRSTPRSKVQPTPVSQPAPSILPQSSAVATQSETAATLRAWQELQAIHYRQANRNLPPSALYGAAAQEYTMVDLNQVDRSLQRYIRDSVKVYREISVQLQPIDVRLAEITQKNQAMTNLGAVVGSQARDQHTPQGNPEAGAFLFGMLGAMASEQERQQLEKEYQTQLQAVGKSMLGLIEQGNAVQSELSGRYPVEFLPLW